MTDEEEKKLEKLDKENMKTVEEVYKNIKEDKEIQKWTEKIKSHEWIKVIEEDKLVKFALLQYFG